MELTQLQEKIERLASLHGGKLGAKVNFETESGTIHLDDTLSPAQVSSLSQTADCTIKISLENMEKMLSGELNPMMAFMMGKMKIDGDKGVAMKLAGLF